MQARYVAFLLTLFLLTSQNAAAITYAGDPDLGLTLALVQAGGGPSNFSAATLMASLAGPQLSAEQTKLTGQYGEKRVQDFLAVFTFAVDDALKIVARDHIGLPASPSPDPGDARALATALYNAGVAPGGKWDVGYMLERLLTHKMHHELMQDMDAHFTPAVNASFHEILTTAMQDLHASYAATEPAGSR